MSLPEEAPAPTKRERIAEAIEREIERLKQLRPALEPRIDRASHILVVHLANPRSGTIRVRIGVGGPRFLVSSLSAGGAVYIIDPRSWRCTCPDAARRNAACKHSVASWILLKADERLGECRVCIDGTVYIGHEEDGVERQEPVPCQRCNRGGR